MSERSSIVERAADTLPCAIVLQRCALLLLAAACSAPPAGPDITVDPCVPIVLVPAADASAAERASIAAAVELWNQTAGAQLTLEDIEGAPRVPVLFRDAPLNFLGVYERGTVLVNRGLSDGPTRSIVLAHELGHSFGLVHVKDRTSVMVAGNATVAPGAVDVVALAALWGACK